jgi:YD repeat-containing protein
MNQVVSRTDPLGYAETWTYDAMGNRSAHIDRLGRTTLFAFDPLDRLTSETWLDGAGVALQAYHFGYDPAGEFPGWC